MLAAKEEKRELLHRKWEEQIAECESSNMPVREWCAVNGVNLNTFYGNNENLLWLDYYANVADVMLFTGCRKSDYRFVILNTE